jgi:hypothetical protein
VDMRRFIAIGAEEAETVALDSKNCWHFVMSFATTTTLPSPRYSPAPAG